MRYLKIFENYQTEAEVTRICKQYGITNWSINKDGLVDVNGDVDLSHKGLTELPLKFGMVSGNFWCSYNKLTTLEGSPCSVGNFYCGYNKLTTLKGAPRLVDGAFNCSWNELTTLEGSPESVGGAFYCSRNNLTTLEGAPQSVNGRFYCEDNKLITLEGAPESVGGNFWCFHNQLTTLKGAPETVGGNFNCSSNPLPDLIQNNIKWIRYIIANQEIYHIYNKDGSLNEYRFRLMMDSMD